MAVYDYVCSKCGYIQEEFHPVNDNPKIKCKKCRSSCKRAIGNGAFILKGDGWPSKDMRRDDYHEHHANDMQKKQDDHAGDKRVKKSNEN